MTTQHKTSLVTPTIDDSSAGYSADDALGGLMTFDNLASIDGGGGFITAITVLSKDPTKTPAFDILIFNEIVTGGSDGTALSISDADIEKLAGFITIVSSDYMAALGANIVGFKEVSIPYKCPTNSRDIFAQMVIRESFTFGATNDVAISLSLFRD